MPKKKVTITSIKNPIVDSPKDVIFGSYRAAPVSAAIKAISDYFSDSDDIDISVIRCDTLEAKIAIYCKNKVALNRLWNKCLVETDLLDYFNIG